MNFEKQVSKAHYNFESYMDKGRWISVWHQLNEVIELAPENVLEVGPGPGLFKKYNKKDSWLPFIGKG